MLLCVPKPRLPSYPVQPAPRRHIAFWEAAPVPKLIERMGRDTCEGVVDELISLLLHNFLPADAYVSTGTHDVGLGILQCSALEILNSGLPACCCHWLFFVDAWPLGEMYTTGL